LTDDEHTIRIISLGGSPIAIDALVVSGAVLTVTSSVTVKTAPIIIPTVQATIDPMPEVTPAEIEPLPEVTEEL
jgi:hypothetical protein